MFTVRNFLTALALVVLGVHPVLSAELEQAMRAVERVRGLAFRHPVTAVTIDRRELPGRLREQVARSMPYSPEEWEEILRALLLVDGQQTQLFSGLIELYESQVLAYYDPWTGTYYSIREPPPAMTAQFVEGLSVDEGVVVHELMHALQDQHFAIGVKDRALRHDADATMAYHALLEGEASLVMMAYMLERSGASFDDVARSTQFDDVLATAATADIAIGSSTPPYFAEMLKFPYLQGLRFAVYAYRRGGWKELDRVHANPPTSTREILHPEDYFERRFSGKPFSAIPAAGVARALSVEHLGEFHWGILAGVENARGWVSDHVTIAQNAACEPTVLVETRWESETAARRFRDAYVNALDSRGVGTYAATDGVTVRVAYGTDAGLSRRFVQ